METSGAKSSLLEFLRADETGEWYLFPFLRACARFLSRTLSSFYNLDGENCKSPFRLTPSCISFSYVIRARINTRCGRLRASKNRTFTLWFILFRPTQILETFASDWSLWVRWEWEDWIAYSNCCGCNIAESLTQHPIQRERARMRFNRFRREIWHVTVFGSLTIED